MLGQANSYLEVASAAFGRRGTQAVQLIMFLLTFGAMTVYFIIIGTLGCQTISQLGQLNATSNATNVSCDDPSSMPWFARRELLSAAVLCLIAPLCLLRNMSALGFVSFLSLGAVFYFMILVVQDSTRHLIDTYGGGGGGGGEHTSGSALMAAAAGLFASNQHQWSTSNVWQVVAGGAGTGQNGSTNPNGTTPNGTTPNGTIPGGGGGGGGGGGDDIMHKLVAFSPKIFFALPIVCLAFLNHTNIHSIVEEMAQPTKPRIRTLVTSSTGIATAFYSLVGVLGYLRFGDATLSDVLLCYTDLATWTETVVFAISRIGMVICLGSSIPLLTFPCRMCFHTILRDVLSRCEKFHSVGGRTVFYLETFFILAAAYGTSVAVPTIETAFGLTGSITGCALVYIFPPASYLRLRHRVITKPEDLRSTRCRAAGAWVVLVVGSMISLVSTGAILYQIIVPSSGS
eukprot:g6563.t1